MQHIGSEHFYQAVVYDVVKALSQGCASYYEGVQTATPESKAFFERLSHEFVNGSDLRREDPAFAKAHASDFQPKPATNDNAFMLKVVEWLNRGTASQKALGGVTCRGLFTLTQATASSAPGRMEPVILDFRNRALAQRIIQSPHDRIFITYGAAHLPGLVAELRKLDPKWAVGSVKWLRTIEAPEYIEGQLRGLGN